MASVTTPVMTAEEFYEWANRPENSDRKVELENGEIVDMPSPGELHGVICWLISHLLGNYLFSLGTGYICTNDTGLIVHRDPDTVRGPDVMLFREGKKFEQLNRKHADSIPDLVVKVFSPNDRVTKSYRRVKQYLQHGVRLVWLVFPEDRSIHVFSRAGEFPTILDESEELTGNGVLPEFRCRVADLFALPGTSS